ncbi:toluene tolerance [Shewanella denitrificans OS217]|jgi:phospholipid transport system substrate-binding protein|uniref:Toluene tolerance n=1 Tax=Shewanella denitrificans (strain OS217 / ATCC BAA-1090 / DSM 15013) TaxID=318161 RepID=Q12RY5_SHEDO|nr:ABC transporter substrate-binding protein [Shewanella denitrificans]ABE53791.1 toluene tolerance [Shewanella denitrificans OS217]
MKTRLGGFFTGLIMLLGVQSFAMAEEVNTTDPYLLIEQAANITFARFRADKALIDADLNHLKVIVKEELMPYVDYKYAAYKVMGQYLRDTSVDQRERFVTAFEGYLVATYAQAFTQYTDQKVLYDPGTDFSKEKMVEVNVQIIEEGRPPIKILFKVRRLKDDSWKAFDLIAEGISLLASKQSEISNLIRKDGIDAVIVLLNEKTKEKIDRKAGADAA